ncbi:MAG TPA: VanW family protein [Acidimicrobiia bacterium]
MKNQLSFRIHPLLAAVIVVGGVFVLLFAAYGLTRWASAGEVLGRVYIAEAEVSGRSEEEALNIADSLEIGRLARQASFEVDDNTVSVQPWETGLSIAKEKVVAEAMAVGRTGNFANQFLFWLGNFFTTTHIELEGSVDPEAMTSVFDLWDTEVIGKPINMGALEIVDGELTAVYPSEGIGVDRPPATEVVLETLIAKEAVTASIPTTTVVPELTEAEVDAALAEAQQMLAGSVEMTYQEETAVFSQAQLVEAFQSETITNSPARIVNSFDPEVVDRLLEPLRSQFEAEPVDAEYVINDNLTVSVKPGSSGTRIDEVETAERLYGASLSPSRTGEIPIIEAAEPDVTTEELVELNVQHLVAQFTTYHSCCEPRVTNIHKIADAVDGVLVRPGETFSLNGHVGERTLEKGYVDAGSIVAGEIVDTIGGGTSQFTTTMYNAVFWGGYEDVEHKPHSYYFSRYPEGIEATLFWQSIDLKFRNNREHAILIDTLYTDTSITVRFFGFNHGRALVGEQSGGQTRIRVDSEGGPEALHVKGDVSERFNVTEPGNPLIRGNPEFEVDQQKTVQSPADGWSVTITRTILRGGTEQVEKRDWVWRYRPQVEIIEVHPCKVPGASTSCPTTTTTTTAPTTTTTIPDSTPTTAAG